MSVLKLKRPPIITPEREQQAQEIGRVAARMALESGPLSGWAMCFISAGGDVKVLHGGAPMVALQAALAFQQHATQQAFEAGQQAGASHLPS